MNERCFTLAIVAAWAGFAHAQTADRPNIPPTENRTAPSGEASMRSIHPIGPAPEARRPAAAAESGVLPNADFLRDFSQFEPGDPAAPCSFLGFVTIADSSFIEESGGVPPMGLPPSTGAPPGNFLWNARDTLNGGLFAGFPGAFCNLEIAEVFAPSAEESLRVQADFYLSSLTNGQWWGPIDFENGFVMDRMFIGGQNLSGELTPFLNDQGLLNRLINLGVSPSDFEVAKFYAPPFHPAINIPEEEWFTVMTHLSLEPNGAQGYSVWLKTQTSADHSPAFLDPRMASGDIVPIDGEPTGWVNTYPGFEDDPATEVIEGVGLAETAEGVEAPTSAPLQQAPPLAAFQTNGWQQGFAHSDPPNADPTTFPADSFHDNYAIAGSTPPPSPLPIPDFTLPFFDGFELYQLLFPLSLQSIWSYGELVDSPALDEQSLGVENDLGDGLYREIIGSPTPTRAWPQDNAPEGGEKNPLFGPEDEPVILSAAMRVDENNATGWSVVADERFRNSQIAAEIILGATTPQAFGGDGEADGDVWVRQINIGSNGEYGQPPGFDNAASQQNFLVQSNHTPETEWPNPPEEPPFNTTKVNIPAKAVDADAPFVFPAGRFATVEVRLLPNPNDDAQTDLDDGVMQLFINGTKLIPGPEFVEEVSGQFQGFTSPGVDADGHPLWWAPSFTVDELEIWSSHNEPGVGDALHIDNVSVSAIDRPRADGPSFSLPYEDGFEQYPPETLRGQGATPFLDLDALPDQTPPPDETPLAVSPEASPPAPGEDICTYQVDEIVIDAGLLSPGDIVAVSHAALPEPFNTIDENNTDCPGVEGESTLFDIRDPQTDERIGEGFWTLQTQQPTTFDPKSGHATGFEYVFRTEDRWSSIGTYSQLVVQPDPGSGNVLRQMNLREFDPLTLDPAYAMVPALRSTLPAAQADEPVPPVEPQPRAQIEFDLFIESVDENGDPVDLPPRSRFSTPINGAGPNDGRIVEIMWGGPNVNQNPALENLCDIPPDEQSSPGVNDDRIWVSATSCLAPNEPNARFIPTDFTLTDLGLINEWFTVRVAIDPDSMYTVEVENSEGAITEIAEGQALDHGAAGIDDEVVNTSGVDSFATNTGLDLGSGGEPAPGQSGAPLPRQRWFIDNVRVSETVVPPCLDLAGDVLCPETGESVPGVDGADLGILLGEWGMSDNPADLNGDGVVDGADLGILLGAWGPCPGFCP